MECFFVAVELLDRPDLVGRPVIVGGGGRRGVVASASYEARFFGVRSAMPTATALRQCPDAVVLSGNMGKYAAISEKIMAIFRSYTPLVEPLSLDEAFCDVSGSLRLYGTPRAIAREIRARVASELGLSCSVGVAANKSIAKLASEAAKPSAGRRGPIAGRGVVVIAPGREIAFLDGLGVRSLFGVGPATEKKLTSLGIASVSDLRATPEATLVRVLGRASAAQLMNLSSGIDERPVVADQRPKSISNEVTFSHDRIGVDELSRDVLALADSVAWRSRRAGMTGRTLTIKIRFADFDTISRSVTARSGFDDGALIYARAMDLITPELSGRGVRLVGVGVSGFDSPSSVTAVAEQFDFSTGANARASADTTDDAVNSSSSGEVIDVMDAVRERFGRSAIVPARLAKTSDKGRGERGESSAASPRSRETPAASHDQGAVPIDDRGRSEQPWGPES